MKTLLVRIGLAVLGLALTLGWWTIHPGASHTQSSNHIPSKVWEGGHTLQVEVESTCAATMRIDFTQHDKPAGEQPSLESWEKIAPGGRSWSIAVPPHVGGYVEIEADSPKVGDRLSMRIRVDGKLIDEKMDKLDSPLPSGTVFAVQDHYDDYSNAGAEASGEGE